MRWGFIAAGLLLAALASAPASANTIATFELENVTFDDGGTASGTFSLDMTTQTVQGVSIAVTTGDPADDFQNGPYSGDPTDFFNPPEIHFNYSGAFGFGFELVLDFGLTGATDLSSLPLFTSLAGREDLFDVHCSHTVACQTRAITGGSVKTVSATPVPATLPLLATALAGMGAAGWRRKRKVG